MQVQQQKATASTCQMTAQSMSMYRWRVSFPNCPLNQHTCWSV